MLNDDETCTIILCIKKKSSKSGNQKRDITAPATLSVWYFKRVTCTITKDLDDTGHGSA